jgi:hypothetical protein
MHMPRGIPCRPQLLVCGGACSAVKSAAPFRPGCSCSLLRCCATNRKLLPTSLQPPAGSPPLPHLEGAAAVWVDALLHRGLEAGQHHALHVGVGQGQDVLQALVPGAKVAQAALWGGGGGEEGRRGGGGGGGRQPIRAEAVRGGFC